MLTFQKSTQIQNYIFVMVDISNPKDALLKLLSDLEDNYLKWYNTHSKVSQYMWHILQILAILPGFITALLAAITNDKSFSQFKIWLVVIPIVGSLVGSLLTKFKIYDVWKIREDGRIAFEYLLNEARGKISIAKSDEDLYKIYENISVKMNEIETEALRKYFSLSSSEFIAKFQQVTPGN